MFRVASLDAALFEVDLGDGAGMDMADGIGHLHIKAGDGRDGTIMGAEVGVSYFGEGQPFIREGVGQPVIVQGIGQPVTGQVVGLADIRQG